MKPESVQAYVYILVHTSEGVRSIELQLNGGWEKDVVASRLHQSQVCLNLYQGSFPIPIG